MNEYYIPEGLAGIAIEIIKAYSMYGDKGLERCKQEGFIKNYRIDPIGTAYVILTPEMNNLNFTIEFD